MRFFLSTTPTAKPAKSNSFFEYIPGISAVSPPIKEQHRLFATNINTFDYF